MSSGNWYDGNDPDDLWQEDGTGINNPCPSGWRVPTEAELDAERQSWDSDNRTGAFNSDLNWPVGGHRRTSGALEVVGERGLVWSSSISDDDAKYLYFMSNEANTASTGHRAHGVSVRCVRDL